MKTVIEDSPGTAKALNRLAREQAKEKLLEDIRYDLTVCELEGWDRTEYIAELREMLNDIGSGRKAGNPHTR